MGLGSYYPGSSYYQHPLVYADRLRGLRVYNTRYVGDMVEVEMSDGNGYRLNRRDFEEASRNGYFYNPAQQTYGQSGNTGGAGRSGPPLVQPGTYQIQPGGVTTQSTLNKLADEYLQDGDGFRVTTVPASQNPRPPEAPKKNTLKRVFYHNRLRKK